MTKTVQDWIEIAEYDLDTAEAMFKAKRYLYVAFMCQQAVEKVLKGIYAQEKKEVPPRTHNLLYLADILGIKFQEQDAQILAYLNIFYLETRYPGERMRLAKEMGKEKAQELLNKSKEVLVCLRQRIR